jgi:hypothetical protein
MGGHLVEEAVPGDHTFREQGLESQQFFFDGGKTQELDDVHH